MLEYVKTGRADHILKGRKIEIKISTVSDFVEAAREETKRNNIEYMNFNQKDLMPLVEWAFETDNRAAWSGYFTTHPFGKRSFRTFGELFRGLRGIASVFRYTSPESTT